MISQKKIVEIVYIPFRYLAFEICVYLTLTGHLSSN